MTRTVARLLLCLALAAPPCLPLARAIAQTLPIDYQRSLLVMQREVVAPHLSDNPCDTEPASVDWSFTALMRGIAGPGVADVRKFTVDWLGLFNDRQTLPNAVTVDPRPGIDRRIVQPWKPDKPAPFRLLAIVNRMDLRKSALLVGENAGEIHFVFGAIDLANNCAPLPMTVIVEYGVRVDSRRRLQDMAQAWIGLSALDPATPDYSRALHAVLALALTGRPGSKPNGSPLNQIRTNEAIDEQQYEMREFRLGDAGALAEDNVTMTPIDTLNGASAFARFLNSITQDIQRQDYWLPLYFPGGAGQALLGGTALPRRQAQVPVWQPPLAGNDPGVFSANTCSGCHGADSGNTVITHINPLLDPNDPYKGASDFLKREATGTRSSDLWEASGYAPPAGPMAPAPGAASPALAAALVANVVSSQTFAAALAVSGAGSPAIAAVLAASISPPHARAIRRRSVH